MSISLSGPVSWGSRIHRLKLYRGVRPSYHKECPVNDTKQSDGPIQLMLEYWRMEWTSSLPLLSGPLWSGVLASDKALSMGQIEINGLLMLNRIVWNRTVFDI